MNVTKLVLVSAATAAVAVAAPATANADSPGTFLSPSGNIICMVGTGEDGSYASCEIRTYHYTPPQAKPGNCGVGWGDRVGFHQGEAPALQCHGDTAFGAADGAPTLPYGQSRTAGTMTCTSKTTGMTCTDSSTGRFFRLSREALTLG